MHLKPNIFEKNYSFFQKWLPLLLRALWTSIKLPKELFFLIWGAPFYFYINFPLYILCREDDSTWSQRNVASLWFYVKIVKEKMFLHPHSKYPRTYTNTRLCVRIKEFSYYTWNVCIRPAHADFHSNFQLDDCDFRWRKLSGMFNVVVKITNAYSHNHAMKNVERMFVFYVDVQ